MKKFSAILLALVLVLAMSATAFAASDGSITINGAIVGKEYKIYKVFDATYSEGTTKNVSYTYTTATGDTFLVALQGNDSPFTLTQIGTSDTYNVLLKEGKTGADVDAFMKANETKLGAPAKDPITATTNTVKFEGLDYGYYYVTSTVGSVVTVTTAAKDATLVEKNTEPNIEKTHSTVDLTAIVGTEVPFTIKATIGVGHTNYKVTDTLTGMTIKSEPTVKIGGQDVSKDNYTYTVNEASNSFTIEFKDAYTASLAKDTVVTIEYTGVITEDAVEVDLIKNTYKFSYDNNDGVEKSDEVVTPLEFDIVKTDADKKLLDGAKFKLTDAEGKTIKVVAKDGYIRPAKDGENGAVEEFTVTGGKITVKGIKEGTYYLVETEAPAGYNKLTGKVTVTLTADNQATIEEGAWVSGGVRVINNAGSELPSTGGMGTTIFYVVGGLMMAAAVVILVAKKKVAAEK